jgi:hypothetical protein
MPPSAGVILERLVGQTVQTLRGRPNVVLAIEGAAVRVGTQRSREGQLVPIERLQTALDRLVDEGEIDVSVDSIGYRSAFIGAVLSSLDETDASPTTMRIRWIGPNLPG